jgi:riboflavin kinase / FMN adenylyltransferase
MQYKIKGKVVKGAGYGRKLGFPTVNLETADKLPKVGVYAGTACFLDKAGLPAGALAKAGIVVDPSGKVEAHLIGYNGDAYGKIVILEINKFLREFKKFENEKELIKQIKKDIKICSLA